MTPPRVPIPQIAIVAISPTVSPLAQPGQPMASVSLPEAQETINRALIAIASVATDPEKIKTTVQFAPFGIVAIIEWLQLPIRTTSDGPIDEQFDIEEFLMKNEGGTDERG